MNTVNGPAELLFSALQVSSVAAHMRLSGHVTKLLVVVELAGLEGVRVLPLPRISGYAVLYIAPQ